MKTAFLQLIPLPERCFLLVYNLSILLKKAGGNF